MSYYTSYYRPIVVVPKVYSSYGGNAAEAFSQLASWMNNDYGVGYTARGNSRSKSGFNYLKFRYYQNWFSEIRWLEMMKNNGAI